MTDDDKPVNITLLWGEFKKEYQVLSITNTTWYQPGMWLNSDKVGMLCKRAGWNVTMVHDDLLKSILTAVAPKLSLPQL